MMAWPSRATTVSSLLLLSSAGLFDFARGSSSAHDNKQKKVLSAFDFENARGRFEQVRAQRLRHEDLAVTTATTGLRHGGDQALPDVSGDRAVLSSKTIPASAILDGKQLHEIIMSSKRAASQSAVYGRDVEKVLAASKEALSRRDSEDRNLQEESDCSDGTTSLLVSSTVFPLLEGCFAPFDLDGTIAYGTQTAIITPFESSTTDPPLWIAVYEASSDDYPIACISAESADEVDPTEATWLCDVDGDGLDYTLADDELSVTCGCSIDSSPTPAPAPSTEPACGDGESFSIESDSLPEAGGCYQDTGLVVSDEALYSLSGTDDLGQIFVFAFEFAPDEDSPSDTVIVWAVALVSSTDASEDSDVYCLSSVEVALFHPSEVPEWICDEGITIDDVECGCSSDPAPVPSPSDQPPTQSPAGTEPESIPEACPGDGSFTIAADAAPVLDGCFEDIGFETDDDTTIYAVSVDSEILVFALEDANGDFNWFIAFLPIDDDVEPQLYCVSAESAIDVNPEDASWLCDFTGDGDFLQATEEDISVTCGSCNTVVPTPQPSASPVPLPTAIPASPPTQSPTARPAATPTSPPVSPTAPPTVPPTAPPAAEPTSPPASPTAPPTVPPTALPAATPTSPPASPTATPTVPPVAPTAVEPTSSPALPTATPTVQPTAPTAPPAMPPTSPTAPPAVPPTLPTSQPAVPPTSPTAPPSVPPTSPTAPPAESSGLLCNSIGCPDGYTPIDDAMSVVCDGDTCEVSQCCEAFCSYHACPDGYVPVSNAQDLMCDATGCTTALCCDLFCSSYPCPNNFVPIENATTTLCDESGCTAASCCVDNVSP